MSRKAEIKEGIFYLDKKPFFLMSAEYPYYRDDPRNWQDRLKKIKDANIDVVTCYIPWRHHMLRKGNEFIVDFEGKSGANRNIKLFTKLCAKNRLMMIVKPGPFIHAELNYGGLPDWVSPERDPSFEPMLDSKNRIVRWYDGNALPTPTGKKFNMEAKRWLSLVNEQIVKKNVYPKGNIIAIQICNEGIYSNAPAQITDYDYSPSGLSLYRRFAKGKKVKVPRDLPRIRTKADLRKYLLWSEWQLEYMRLVYKEFCSVFKSKVPFVININPPSADKGLDHWLSRVIPEKWPNVHFGFTNWLQAVSEDEPCFYRYCLLAKRRRGPNLEENWGFSKLYDHRFKYPVTCVFQTLLAIANGATGFNVYTVANTSNWDNLIDDEHKRPYPDSSPIREDGKLTKKYKVLKLLASFFKENGADLLVSKPNSKIAWGFYPPYAYLAAWDIPRRHWRHIGVERIRCGYKGIDRFQRILRKKNIDYQILNINFASLKQLSCYKYIILYGGFFMDRKTQTKLSKYVDSGGKLVFIGTVPLYDEHFKRCDILRDKAICLSKIDDLLSTISDSDNKLKVPDSKTQVWVYENSKKDVSFFFIFNLSGRSEIKEFSYLGKGFKINLATKSAAVIKLKGSKLDSVFIKGVNELKKSSAVPKVFFAGEKIEAKAPCDLLALRRRGRWQIQLVN